MAPGFACKISPQIPTMSHDAPPSARSPPSQPLCSSFTRKRLEQICVQFRINTASRVLNMQQQVVLKELRPYRDLSLAGDGLNGVFQKVMKNALHWDPVESKFKIGRDLGLKRYSGRYSPFRQIMPRRLNQVLKQ